MFRVGCKEVEELSCSQSWTRSANGSVAGAMVAPFYHGRHSLMERCWLAFLVDIYIYIGGVVGALWEVQPWAGDAHGET